MSSRYATVRYRKRGVGTLTGASQVLAVSRPRAGVPVVRLAPPKALKFQRAIKKGGKGRTGTKTIVKSKLNQRVRTDGPFSESFYHYKLPLMKFRIPKFTKEVTGVQNWITNDTLRVSCVEGQQQYKSVGKFFQTSDLNGIMNQAIALTPSGATYGDVKAYLTKCVGTVMCTNDTNDIVRVKFLDLVCRKDLRSAAAPASSYYPPEGAWFQGATDMNAAGAVTLLPGSMPFQVPAFTTNYKVCKITDVVIHSGGHHIHTVTMSPRHMFNKEWLNELGTTTNCVKGLTCFTLVITSGFPLNDNAGAISTASNSLDFVWTANYTYRVFSTNTNTIVNTINNLGVLAQHNIINDLTGAATTITTV